MMSNMRQLQKPNKMPAAGSHFLNGYAHSFPQVICWECGHIHEGKSSDGRKVPSTARDDKIKSSSSDQKKHLGLETERNVKGRPTYREIQNAKLIRKHNLEHSRGLPERASSSIASDNASVKSLGSIASTSSAVSKKSVKSNRSKMSVQSNSTESVCCECKENVRNNNISKVVFLITPCSCGCTMPPNIPPHMPPSIIPCMLTNGDGFTVPGMMVYNSKTGVNYFCHPHNDTPCSVVGKPEQQQHHPAKACCSSCKKGGVCASSKVSRPANKIRGSEPNRLDGLVPHYTGHIPGLIYRIGEPYGRSCGILLRNKECAEQESST